MCTPMVRLQCLMPDASTPGQPGAQITEDIITCGGQQAPEEDFPVSDVTGDKPEQRLDLISRADLFVAPVKPIEVD